MANGAVKEHILDTFMVDQVEHQVSVMPGLFNTVLVHQTRQDGGKWKSVHGIVLSAKATEALYAVLHVMRFGGK